MFASLSKSILKIFGTKQERDIKATSALVAQINELYQSYHNLSNDELREKTIEFKEKIQDYLAPIDQEITQAKLSLKGLTDSNEKDKMFKQIENLEKKRDQSLEEILDTILPEAFAVVKQTAYRFTNHTEIKAKATDLDKKLSENHPHITIEADLVSYQNSWKAAGNDVLWNMVHYDVQLIGGIMLHKGKIAEMATGEGKTLVATLPVYLNALAGQGVHLVTVNDYLARRDSQWNAPIFNFLGLSVACIDDTTPHSQQRKEAYRADITYGTNNEYGFDYLRDNMVEFQEEIVQRKLHFAIVDEADSVLIDDARTPLIISGRADGNEDEEKLFTNLKPAIAQLVEAQKNIVIKLFNEAKAQIAEGKISDTEGGLALFRAFRGWPKYQPLIKYLSEEGVKQILLKTEARYLENNQKEMPKVDEALLFVIEEKHNSVILTDKGIEFISKNREDKSFFVIPDLSTEMGKINKSNADAQEKIQLKQALMQEYQTKSERLHIATQLLKAYNLFEKDIQYVVIDGKVKIVDENTGRIMEGRRYSDGLHQAIEAKENVTVEASSQTVATVTLQNFFRMYHKLSGMTGTAETEAQEFWDIYKLDVSSIPTNKPLARKDRNDLIYKTKREKYNAIIQAISDYQAQGRPVLVGTTNVEISELLGRMLKMRNIKHNVLNAKHHGREAEIVAEAGQKGAVTIATNMAGRGTDIKLSPEVIEAGGLVIIGSERHDSRRIDRQLRGRAGRQGDPGESVFYVSLEDDLMRIFGSERISKVMDTLGLQEGEVIEHSLITKNIERAQKRVEENNFGVRKRLLEYDDIMNQQREIIYRKRRNAIVGDKLQLDIENLLRNSLTEFYQTYESSKDIENFNLDLIYYFGISIEGNDDISFDDIYQKIVHVRAEKHEEIVKNLLPFFTQVHQNEPQFLNIVLPVKFQNHQIDVYCRLKDAVETAGSSIIRDIEKSIVISIFDNLWKTHLREMDELKQSVQNAALEQKDPLVIYKKESYELFKRMIQTSNYTLSMHLSQYQITIQNNENLKATQVQQVTKLDNLQTNTQDFENDEYGVAEEAERVKKQPIRVDDKTGRNEPCPCGSGKKFKNCHGK